VCEFILFYFFCSVLRCFLGFTFFPNCKLVWLQFMDRTILFSSDFVFPHMKYLKCNNNVL